MKKEKRGSLLTVPEEVRIPNTGYMLEKGDRIEVLYEQDDADPKTSKIIKDLANAYGDSNEDQGKMVQLLKGLAFDDDPKANEFMKALDKATTKISKEVLGEGD